MTDLTETMLRAAARLEDDAEHRARREHDIRLMRSLAESLRGSADEHHAGDDGNCAACTETPYPCPSALRWLAIANIALEERPQKR
jgi:hypothetical protein